MRRNGIDVRIHKPLSLSLTQQHLNECACAIAELLGAFSRVDPPPTPTTTLVESERERELLYDIY